MTPWGSINWCISPTQWLFSAITASELAEVWRYGPIYSSLYSATKEHLSTPIFSPMIPAGMMHIPQIPSCDEVSHKLIKDVCAAFYRFNSLALSSYCHGEGGAWKVVAESYGFKVKPDTTVSENMMLTHNPRHHIPS